MLPEPEEFANRRKKLGFNQSEFAKLMGISQSYLAKFENNEASLKYSDVKRIEHELSIRENKGKLAMDIMSHEVLLLSTENTLKEAIFKMQETGFSQIPITNHKKRIVGCITESRTLELIEKHSLDAYNKKLLEVMAESLPVVSISTNLSTLRQKLKEHPAVLVMDNGQLKGIISKTDVLMG